MSLLSIVQTAVEEIGELDPISYVAGNTGNPLTIFINFGGVFTDTIH
jgi:hypothetical protein